MRKSAGVAVGIGATALLKGMWWDLRLARLLTYLFLGDRLQDGFALCYQTAASLSCPVCL